MTMPVRYRPALLSTVIVIVLLMFGLTAATQIPQGVALVRSGRPGAGALVWIFVFFSFLVVLPTLVNEFLEAALDVHPGGLWYRRRFRQTLIPWDAVQGFRVQPASSMLGYWHNVAVRCEHTWVPLRGTWGTRPTVERLHRQLESALIQYQHRVTQNE